MIILFSDSIELLKKQSVYAVISEERVKSTKQGISILFDARHAERIFSILMLLQSVKQHTTFLTFSILQTTIKEPVNSTKRSVHG